jgi:hypothetical protein
VDRRNKDEVREFQRKYGLVADGLFGPDTFDAWVMNAVQPPPLKTVKVPLNNKHVADNLTYRYIKVREDVASRLQAIVEHLESRGGVMTTAGGLRLLSSPVTAARSPTSYHYLGTAFDLGTYTGMVDPDTDPFVVEQEGNCWRVWARVTDQNNQYKHTLKAVVANHKAKTFDTKTVSGQFLNFTDLCAVNGFSRIASRAVPKTKTWYAGTEWWHFQAEPKDPDAFYGDELLKTWSLEQASSSAAWEHRHKHPRGRGWT